MNPTNPHTPLSVSLEQILEHGSDQEQITLNSLLKKTEGRGLYLVMILLCLPFVTVNPLPGASVVFGLVIMFMSLRLAFELPPDLPNFIGNRSLPPKAMKTVLRASVRVLRLLERMVKPRSSAWMNWQVIRSANALLVCFMAFLLFLPLPPIPPLTNTLPGWAIVLLAISMMEEDGVMIWLGYAVSAGTTIYFIVIGDFIYKFLSTHLAKMIHWVAHLL